MRFRAFLLFLVLVAAAAGYWAMTFVQSPLPLPRTPYEFTVKSGANLRTLSRQLANDGLLPDPHSFWILGRALSQDAAIHAGTYRLDKPVTPRELLDKLKRGEVVTVRDLHAPPPRAKKELAP